MEKPKCNWGEWMRQYGEIFDKYCLETAKIRDRQIGKPISYDVDRMLIVGTEVFIDGDILFKTIYEGYPLMDLAYRITRSAGDLKIANRYFLGHKGQLLENSI